MGEGRWRRGGEVGEGWGGGGGGNREEINLLYTGLTVSAVLLW